MYKEKLQNIITEKFVNDKITTSKYLRLSKKIEDISEGKALDLLILQEQKWAAFKAGATAMAKKAGSKLYSATGIPTQKALYTFMKDPEQAKEAISILKAQLANAKGNPSKMKAISRRIWAIENPKKALALIGGAQVGAVGATGAAAYGAYKFRNKK